MSMNLVPMPQPESDEVTLPITFPKEKERYDLNGKGLVTDATLEPLMRVSGTFTGAVASLTTKFTEGTGKWVIIVDDCEITPG